MELVAVNHGDDAAQINKYTAEGGFTFKIAMDRPKANDTGLSGKYGVKGYPSNYLLDSNGKIVFRSVGFDEAGIRAALAKLGVK